MISAPLRTDTTSAARDPNNRSDAFSFPKSFPIKDLFETETKIGYCCLMDFKFRITDRSLFSQSDLIFVKKYPFPDFLKKPIAGSKTILLDGIPAIFAIFRLAFKRFLVDWILPDTILESNAHKISDGLYSLITSIILSSYFNPEISLIISIPCSKADFAIFALHVSTDIGRSDTFRIILIAFRILWDSIFSDTDVDRYGAVDIPPMSIKSAPSISICFIVFMICCFVVLIDFL